MISNQTLSKVEFHSTSERARKDWLAELYLRVNTDREVCVVYILIMIYFASLLHRFLLIVLLLISVSCHVNFRLVVNKLCLSKPIMKKWARFCNYWFWVAGGEKQCPFRIKT